MKNLKNKGLLIIISGPSGVGKGTVREVVMRESKLHLYYSISMTTRECRPGEVDGKDYYFVSREEFDKNIENNNLLEWAEYVGNRYGTPQDKLDEMRNDGKNVLLEIEVNGARQVLDKEKDAVSIFILPPNKEALAKRLKGRGTECEEVIRNRVNKAVEEIKLKTLYKYNVVNDTVERAAKEILEIIEKEIKEHNNDNN